MQFPRSRFPGLYYLAALGIACLVPVAGHAGSVTSDGPDLVIKTKGGLEIRTADKKYSFKVGGSLQLDYTDYDGIFNRADDGASGSDLDFRRVRINLSGQVAPEWKYKFEYDFQGSGKTTDVYFDYTGFGKMAKLSMGKLKVPFGMDELTSSKDTLAIERNAISQAFAPSRLNGITLSGYNDYYQYKAGLFKGGSDDNDNIEWTFGARYTFTPIRTPDMVVHLGIAWVDSDVADGVAVGGANTATHSTFSGAEIDFTPEVKGGAEKFASPPVAYDSYDGLALEIAGTMGPLFYQFEYHDMTFDGGAVDTGWMGSVPTDTGIDIDGYSAQVAWVLTGETRPYKGKNGVFGAIKPKGPGGAWEVFLRYSDIDMGDTDNRNLSGFDDTQLTTIGLNWYVNSQVRAALNLVSGEADARDALDDDGDAMIARLQYRF